LIPAADPFSRTSADRVPFLEILSVVCVPDRDRQTFGLGIQAPRSNAGNYCSNTTTYRYPNSNHPAYGLFPLKEKITIAKPNLSPLFFLISMRKIPAVPGPSGSPTPHPHCAQAAANYSARHAPGAPHSTSMCSISTLPPARFPQSRMPACAINTKFVKQSNLSS
jgi:hypothetical protein